MSGKKSNFKLPKYLLDRAKALETETKLDTASAQTAEDYYDLGVNEEESGDRWFSSDLSKSLRFYHRAHNYYKTCLKMDPNYTDALFNLPRLEFEVYIRYLKDDSVIKEDLDNCADPLNDTGPGGLFQELVSICTNFEQCIDLAMKSGAAIGWDFCHTLALCYFEYIELLCNDVGNISDINENPNSEIMLALQRTIFWFNQVLDKLETLADAGDETSAGEYIPQVICDAYNLIATVNESLYNSALLDTFSVTTSSLLSRIDEMANKLIAGNTISQNHIVNINVAKLNQLTSGLYDFDALIRTWNSQNELLEGVIEKALLEASSYRSFLDKFEDGALSDDTKWLILSHMSAFYKALYEMLRSEVANAEKAKESESDTLSSKISMLCSITIERADIELERSLLDVELAKKNQAQLQLNTRNILKNAIIFSKKSGGLKESVGSKLARAKKQREAVMRLCLLDNKSQAEWDVILGPKYWPAELINLEDIEAYRRLFS